MVFRGFLAMSYFFAVALISTGATHVDVQNDDNESDDNPKFLLKKGVHVLATTKAITDHLLVNYTNVTQNGEYWDVLLALADLLDFMKDDSDAKDLIRAACNWVNSTSTTEFDCTLDSLSAQGTMIRIIRDNGSINEALDPSIINAVVPTATWKSHVTNKTDNTLVHDIVNQIK